MNKLNSNDDTKKIISAILHHPTGISFGKVELDFCQQLSQTLVSEKNIRQYSELVALGFWCRSANVEKLKQQYHYNERIYCPRGLAFHITPANVEVMFAYSWLLSLLMGNKNIVRLSTKGGNVLNILLGIINKILAKKEFSTLKHTNYFIQYEHNRSITDFLSESCDVRVIWGGDKTISEIRKSPISAKTKDIVFADRFSFALINAQAIIDIKNEPEQLAVLAQAFYKDVTIYGQQACSSPRLLVWYGNNDDLIEHAKQIFWEHISPLISSGINDVSSSTAINKMVHSQYFTALGNKVDLTLSPVFHRVKLKKFLIEFQENHCGEGLLFEMHITSLEKLNKITNKSFQTCAYYGFDSNTIRNLLSSGAVHNILRFVPIGHALEFDHYWDGMDVLSELSMVSTFQF